MTSIPDMSCIEARKLIIKEVFIEPIRTVVVIDDEFPTIDSLLSNSAGQTAVSWNNSDILRAQQILKFARSKQRPWLVDIHDGKQIKPHEEVEIAPYMDHSDLLVLDYHLEGDHGSSDASIGIIRKLAINGHHNLVVVYTKGISGQTAPVLRDIAVSLTREDPLFASKASEIEAIDSQVDTWEDNHPGLRAHLIDEVTTDLFIRHRRNSNYGAFVGNTESASFKALLDPIKQGGEKIDMAKVAHWAFFQRQRKLCKSLFNQDAGEIVTGQKNDICWLKADRLFLIVLSKDVNADSFEDSLTEALVDSYPSPHKILLARMRNAIDLQGTSAENTILADKHVQTAWLDDFLNRSPADEYSAVSSTVSRHWEALGDELRADIMPFSMRLRSTYQNADPKDVFKQCGLNKATLNQSDTIANYNRYISTKPIDRSHLTTGHLFYLVGAYWICLSPACDMVPGQKTGGWNSRLGTSLPFIGFKLTEQNQNALKKAASNNFLYVSINNATKAFSIYPDGTQQTNPEWEQFFAQNHGRFHDNNKVNITITKEKEGKLAHEQCEAEVVSQVRAEYALNLLHRVGYSFFRPGLGMYFKALAD